MDDESSQKKKSFEAIITAINMAAMGVGIAAAVFAANKRKSDNTDAERIEKSIGELKDKFDMISQQLKNMHPGVRATTKETENPENSPQPSAKPQQQQQDVIYVRKSSEFSFYN